MKIEMTHIVEEEDGSRYFFEMNQEGVDHMVTLGLELALSCAIYGVDPRVVLDGIPALAEKHSSEAISGPYSPENIGEMLGPRTEEPEQ